MTEDKAKSANYQSLATSAGILTDKIQLLKGDPTERIEMMPKLVYDLVDIDAIDAIEEGKTLENPETPKLTE